MTTVPLFGKSGGKKEGVFYAERGEKLPRERLYKQKWPPMEKK